MAVNAKERHSMSEPESTFIIATRLFEEIIVIDAVEFHPSVGYGI